MALTAEAPAAPEAKPFILIDPAGPQGIMVQSNIENYRLLGVLVCSLAMVAQRVIASFGKPLAQSDGLARRPFGR